VQRGQPAKGTAVRRALVPESAQGLDAADDVVPLGPPPRRRGRAAGTLEEEEAGPATAGVRRACWLAVADGVCRSGLWWSAGSAAACRVELPQGAVAEHRRGGEEERAACVRLFVFSGLGWAF